MTTVGDNEVFDCSRLLMETFVTNIFIFLSLGLVLTEDTCDNQLQCSSNVKQPERTFLAVKPDAVQRGLVGEIISRLERKGFQMVAMKLVKPDRNLLELHYDEHREKPFFPFLIDYMESGPVLATVWEGAGVLEGARRLLGATNPLTAAPGTIRGDLGLEPGRNLCHASDSTEAARREIKLWFQSDLLAWSPALHNWVHET